MFLKMILYQRQTAKPQNWENGLNYPRFLSPSKKTFS